MLESVIAARPLPGVLPGLAQKNGFFESSASKFVAYSSQRKRIRQRTPMRPSPFDAMCGDFARVVGCVGHRQRLIESRIRRGNPEYAHGILHDIRNFVRSVRDEYLEYRNSRLEDLPRAQAPRKRPEGRRLGSDPPAAPAAASGFRSSTVGLKRGNQGESHRQFWKVPRSARGSCRLRLDLKPSIRTTKLGPKRDQKMSCLGPNAEFQSCGS
jgi:hypothetical protein